MSALGWLASSGCWDLVRIRWDLAAAAPQGGSEPKVADAAMRNNVRFRWACKLLHCRKQLASM
jgi:hypothetical protein